MVLLAFSNCLVNGRKDESGDFTKGAGLVKRRSTSFLRQCIEPQIDCEEDRCTIDAYGLRDSEDSDRKAANELDEIGKLVAGVRLWIVIESVIDPSVVRGLEYYTGPVYEVELLLETKDEKGRPVRFGSVGGGGRYDGLVSRFRGEPVPATGFSIGVSRLQAALTMLGKLDTRPEFGPVVVTVFDRDRVADYQKMVAQLAQREHPRRALSRQSRRTWATSSNMPTGATRLA